MKEIGCLDFLGLGFRGFLIISDIRLLLKKEFVIKIGIVLGRRKIRFGSVFFIYCREKFSY